MLGLHPKDGERELLVIFVVVLVVGIVCMLCRAGFVGIWNKTVQYPAGMTTNAADVSYGSGYPDATYVGRDWTAQPFGGQATNQNYSSAGLALGTFLAHDGTFQPY